VHFIFWREVVIVTKHHSTIMKLTMTMTLVLGFLLLLVGDKASSTAVAQQLKDPDAESTRYLTGNGSNNLSNVKGSFSVSPQMPDLKDLGNNKCLVSYTLSVEYSGDIEGEVDLEVLAVAQKPCNKAFEGKLEFLARGDMVGYIKNVPTVAALTYSGHAKSGDVTGKLDIVGPYYGSLSVVSAIGVGGTYNGSLKKA
jgi:hypothetical protein